MTNNLEEQKFDNGGAEAIKGFNFQKANLILLAIDNYNKKNFKIYVEAEDDIVVTFENYQAFIQVKKQIHNFNSITKPKKDSPSILEKNLKFGTKADTFKLFVKDVKPTDKKKLIRKSPGTICSEIYALDTKIKNEICKKIPSELADKIDNFYFFVSPVNENLDEAEKYLIGTLNKNDISVDNKQGRSIIAELALTIDQMAEKTVLSDIDKEKKYLDKDYFSKIFITCKSINHFDTILNSLKYNSIYKQMIKKERLKIELNKTSLKADMKEALKTFLETNGLVNITEKEMVDYLVKKFLSKKENEVTLISIAIVCICEIGDEIKNDY